MVVFLLPESAGEVAPNFGIAADFAPHVPCFLLAVEFAKS
jgi:hypothetical protein